MNLDCFIKDFTLEELTQRERETLGSGGFKLEKIGLFERSIVNLYGIYDFYRLHTWTALTFQLVEKLEAPIILMNNEAKQQITDIEQKKLVLKDACEKRFYIGAKRDATQKELFVSDSINNCWVAIQEAQEGSKRERNWEGGGALECEFLPGQKKQHVAQSNGSIPYRDANLSEVSDKKDIGSIAKDNTSGLIENETPCLRDWSVPKLCTPLITHTDIPLSPCEVIRTNRRVDFDYSKGGIKKIGDNIYVKTKNGIELAFNILLGKSRAACVMELLDRYSIHGACEVVGLSKKSLFKLIEENVTMLQEYERKVKSNKRKAYKEQEVNDRFSDACMLINNQGVKENIARALVGLSRSVYNRLKEKYKPLQAPEEECKEKNNGQFNDVRTYVNPVDVYFNLEGSENKEMYDNFQPSFGSPVV